MCRRHSLSCPLSGLHTFIEAAAPAAVAERYRMLIFTPDADFKRGTLACCR
jgi:hypothetical protein